jgi:predicted ATP-grasp superfamily ATP-dependent carboligase
MTRILVYEWCCATAREDSSRAVPLEIEGRAMLAAAADDFRRVDGVEVTTVLNEGPDGEPAAFRAAAANADFALVIAPEFDRILETRCQWALEAGAELLGPSPKAVVLTADKLALARHLERCGVPTPETTSTWEISLSNFPPPYVVKMRFGAGSQDVLVCTDPITAEDVDHETAGAGDTIVQPLVTGFPASVAFLIGPRRTHVLPPAEQFVSLAGNFRYLGGRSPLPEPLADRAIRIARRAIECVPGLTGYVGVDLILGNDRDYAIEINPRLTTSYVGLRMLTNDNLMEMLLRLARGESIPAPRWHGGSVSWTPDGATNIAPP